MNDNKLCVSKDCEGLLTLLQNVRANSENHMRQQWTATYYVLLLYAAIIYVSKFFSKAYDCESILVALAIIILLSGIYINWALERSIEMNREIVFDIYEEFPQVDKIIKNRTKLGDKVSLAVFFYIFNSLGCFVTLAILYKCKLL